MPFANRLRTPHSKGPLCHLPSACTILKGCKSLKITQPSVARNELPWVSQPQTGSTLKALNHVVTGGQGQQAYVGYFPPAPGYSNLFVWHPINFSPIAAGLPLVLKEPR